MGEAPTALRAPQRGPGPSESTCTRGAHITDRGSDGSNQSHASMPKPPQTHTGAAPNQQLTQAAGFNLDASTLAAPHFPLFQNTLRRAATIHGGHPVVEQETRPCARAAAGVGAAGRRRGGVPAPANPAAAKIPSAILLLLLLARSVGRPASSAGMYVCMHACARSLGSTAAPHTQHRSMIYARRPTSDR